MKRLSKTRTEPKSRITIDPKEIEHLVHQLKRVHAAAITAQLALRQQNAEYDREIADVLRTAICDPLADQLEALRRNESVS